MRLSQFAAWATPVLTVQGALIPTPEGIIGGDLNAPGSRHEVLIDRQLVPNQGVQRVPNQLRNVIENSGICETTSGVYQASGYGDIGNDGSIWFWFFAARNNPQDAPLTLWFNGGPGSSSMIGLIQEHGPCRINNDSDTVSPNRYSWNENSNMLYIDQPVGVGYSSGSRIVGTSSEAARDIWTFMQTWLSDSRFSQYQSRDLAIWTESYGGHYGPAFASYFLSQNAAIASGDVSGLTLNLNVLGIGNGLTAALPQYQGMVDYASNNPYRKFNSTALDLATEAWERSGGCKDQITGCKNNGTDSTCAAAQLFCNTHVLDILSRGINVYYSPNAAPDPYPRNITTYMNSIRPQLNADVPWMMFNASVYGNFLLRGDWMRDYSTPLESVINAGIRTIIYNGDADFLVNYQGVERMLDGLNSKFSDEFRQQQFSDWVVAGQKTGLYKNAGTLSYVRIFGAGHEVPAYTYGSLEVGQAALQMFNQIMSNQSISSDGSNNSGNGNGSMRNIHSNLLVEKSLLVALVLPWIFL